MEGYQTIYEIFNPKNVDVGDYFIRQGSKVTPESPFWERMRVTEVHEDRCSCEKQLEDGQTQKNCIIFYIMNNYIHVRVKDKNVVLGIPEPSYGELNSAILNLIDADESDS